MQDACQLCIIWTDAMTLSAQLRPYQGVSIATPGCDVVGIISHEIGHALGIFHEQARPDQVGEDFLFCN
ncbi:hypothetical protein ANCDUO_01233 [Ancylostoma duodenale]|uniref:Peptidase M12A domain-containing protein n=1 Tax=Ancylostoma duodenale TaxID=51022 RepID=A0A0C2H3N5_9BILA|nr:hypothetical protein ANCDUO_01233 [Ancylostoma duodenale]